MMVFNNFISTKKMRVATNTSSLLSFSPSSFSLSSCSCVSVFVSNFQVIQPTRFNFATAQIPSEAKVVKYHSHGQPLQVLKYILDSPLFFYFCFVFVFICV